MAVVQVVTFFMSYISPIQYLYNVEFKIWIEFDLSSFFQHALWILQVYSVSALSGRGLGTSNFKHNSIA